jgi:hypothetical protein
VDGVVFGPVASPHPKTKGTTSNIASRRDM